MWASGQRLTLMLSTNLGSLVSKYLWAPSLRASASLSLPRESANTLYPIFTAN